MMMKPSAAPWPFCVLLSPSVHQYARFYIAVLSIIFFLGFRQWRSRADKILTLNINTWLPLFWSTWSRARGPDSATCAGLAHGRDHSHCKASKQKVTKGAWPLFFLELSKIIENKGPLWRFFKPQFAIIMMLTSGNSSQADSYAPQDYHKLECVTILVVVFCCQCSWYGVT